MNRANDLGTNTSIDFFHRFSHIRVDTWGKVKELSKFYEQPWLSESRVRAVHRTIGKLLKQLVAIEEYTAFPSKSDMEYLWSVFQCEDYASLNRAVHRIERALLTDSYRSRHLKLNIQDISALRVEDEQEAAESQWSKRSTTDRPYFELQVIDNFKSIHEEESLRSAFLELRHPEDEFVYDVATVKSFEDSLIGVLINPNIQACVIRYGFPLRSVHGYDVFRHYLLDVDESRMNRMTELERSIELGLLIKKIRPEIDLFLMSGVAVEKSASLATGHFERIFYREPGYLECHQSILRSIHSRYQTPFFSALKKYSRRPTGVFHALPISRGMSIRRSHWIKDFSDFYGDNIFMAETSATSGGLDSLLQPTGPLKEAQAKAARAYGSKETYFVTNGTSTANKIVLQALIEPGDVVLVDRDCHKSHHYGMVLMGARTAYLDAYPLDEFSMYGAVPLRSIKQKLLEYERAGRLDEVRLLILTNCTFDGMIYNVYDFMEQCLAIKPDLIFLWDEAWFGFACFNPLYRTRTGMAAARALKRKYQSPDYAKRYAAYCEERAGLDLEDDASWLDHKLLPDPDKVRLRVYSTQSTHKTLTSMRQGSMIHVYDQDFRHRSKAAFDEAYMTHTSTSPNYQILSSLDAGRRQVELEGYELVHKQIAAAMTLREQIYNNKRLSKYFRVLVSKDLVPAAYRLSGVESYYEADTGWSRMEDAWMADEFVIDLSRITLHVGRTGVDGDTFKNEYLMDQFGIQINKTSRNTVLFMTHIGTNRSSVTFLLEVLEKIAEDIDQKIEDYSKPERKLFESRVRELTEEQPPLPDFSSFHEDFRQPGSPQTSDGDIRTAYFKGFKEELCEYIRFDNGDVFRELEGGRELVSAGFVTPYPPGFPVLVPGQTVSREIIEFLMVLDVKEIHGYRAELGLRVFKQR
ncbi:MAG: ornithine decarboxylase [Halioglobus sp.]